MKILNCFGLFLAVFVFSGASLAFKTKDAECLGSLFPLRLPALESYKWATKDDKTLVGLSVEGHTSIVNENGTYLIKDGICGMSNPDRTFSALIVQAATGAKGLYSLEPDIWNKVVTACKDAESKTIRDVVAPKVRLGEDAKSLKSN